MMKWGRKKPSSASPSSTSSSHSHLISHVFPLSWLSKFKQAGEKPGPRNPKNSRKEKHHPSLQRVNSRSSPKHPTHCKDNRFYTQDNDGFWRLSFGEDNNNMGGENKVFVPQPYCGNCKSQVKEVAAKKKVQNFSKAVVAQEQKEAPRDVIVPEKATASRETAKEEVLQRTYRRIMEATEELHRELDEVNGYRKSVEKEMTELELLQVMQMVGKTDKGAACSDTGKHRSSPSTGFEDGGGRLEWQQLKDAKIREVLQKNEKQRKSFHVSRESQSKVKVRSPRTPSKIETCKIKALEDLKKAKLKKKIKEIQLEDKAVALGSFAMVKRSRDPQQDFRDSMVEMIIEKRIRRPEELEELLACYLTLNADEYHDLIIKVFQQVWCELEESYFNQKPKQRH